MPDQPPPSRHRALGRPRPVRWAAAALVLSGTACALPTPELAPPPRLPAAWEETAPGASAVPPGPAADPVAWWSRFDDPVLDDLVARAITDNLDLAQAMQRVLQARAQIAPADAQFRPSLNASGQLSGERRLAGDLPDLGAGLGDQGPGAGLLSSFEQPRDTVGWRAGLDASWEVGLFGRATAQSTAARAAAAAAEEEAAAARVSLVAEVVRTYLELRAAQHRARLLEASARAQRRLLSLTADRRRAGLASDLDVDRSTSSLRQVEAQLPQADAAARRAARRLATLVGEASPDPRLAASRGQELAQPLARAVADLGVPADLLRARPDVRSAELGVVRAAAELGLARADLWPRLTLTGGLTVNATVVGASFTSPAGPLTYASGGPTLSLPLFDWGVRRANVEVRGAQLAEASLAYRQTVLEAVAEVEDALSSLAAERARAQRLEQAEAAAARALRRAEDMYAQGLVGFLDRLQAEQDLLSVRIDLATAREAEALAVVALHKALGGGVPAAEPAP